MPLLPVVRERETRCFPNVDTLETQENEICALGQENLDTWIEA